MTPCRGGHPWAIRTVLAPAVACALLAVRAHAGATDLLRHAPLPLALPTYEGSGQAVEPDVVWIPGGWQGYTHWMAVTPYPCGDETAENPSILASQDGVTWETPVVDGVRAPAPLVDNPEPCAHYAYSNNDPSLVMAGDSLAIYYLVTWWDGPRIGTTDFRRIASADGVHWTPGDAAPTLWTLPNYVLSPSVVHDDRGWRMWYVATTNCRARDAQIRTRSSPDGRVWPDSTDRAVKVDGGHGLPFHATMKALPGGYAMVFVAFPAAAGCGMANTLYYAESVDGLVWHSQGAPILSPSPQAGDWDAGAIYRSSFVGRYPNLGVWYSAYGNELCRTCDGRRQGPVWRVGFTSVGDYKAAPAEITDVAPPSRLLGASPNPTASSTAVRFELSRAAKARLDVLDLAGRRVALLADDTFAAGQHAVTWDVAGTGGAAAPPGVYFARLRIDGEPLGSIRVIVRR